MPDTIKLEIQQSKYTVIDHDRFEPSTRDMFGSTPWAMGKVLYSKQNPTATDRKAGIYKPRLTIARRPLKNLGYQNTLYVEFSAPKLVFGNNIDELTNEDFELVKDVLTETLKSMGVLVYKSQLNEVEVSLIHYGKNVVLDDYTTPYTYMKELRNVDIGKIHDVNQTDYRNGGLSYKFRTNLSEMTFYDKLKDLERSKFSEKRAIDQDEYCQLSLLDQINAVEKTANPFEVLRLEVRLNNRRTIKKALVKLGLDDCVTFERLFNQDLAKQILLSFYKPLLAKYVPTIETNSPVQAFEKLKIANPRVKEGKLLELVTAQSIINQRGVAEFRNIVSDTSWYRLKRSLKTLKASKQANHLDELLGYLNDFKRVRLIDYPQLIKKDVN